MKIFFLTILGLVMLSKNLFGFCLEKVTEVEKFNSSTKNFLGEIKDGYYSSPSEVTNISFPVSLGKIKKLKEMFTETYYLMNFTYFDGSVSLVSFKYIGKGLYYSFSKKKLKSLQKEKFFIEFMKNDFEIKKGISFHRYQSTVEEKYLYDKKAGHLYWGSLKDNDSAYCGYLQSICGSYQVKVFVSIDEDISPYQANKKLLDRALEIMREIKIEGFSISESGCIGKKL